MAKDKARDATAKGAQKEQTAPAEPQLSPEIADKIASLRSHVRESFGKVVMSMMMLPDIATRHWAICSISCWSR